jgi:pimeloyl-ACP methyl ester carboxylesterase
MSRAVVASCLAAVLVATAWATPQTSPPALERLTVSSDGHPMAVWARRPASPRGAVLLVHGRTWSSRPDFDLQVPGMQRSVLVSLAARGWAAYAVDLRGYGETPRDATGWMTPRRSALDLVNVLAWIAQQHPSLPRPALVGWSRGAAMAMLAAQQAPPRASALVMFGFAFDPDDSFADGSVPEKPAREKNTAESAASDFISPAVTPPAVIKAFVAQALKADPILADVKDDAELNALDPRHFTVPTLVIYGERDSGIEPADARKFVAQLAATDKRLVVLPGADHAAHLENTHEAWIAAVDTFLARSAARADGGRARSIGR